MKENHQSTLKIEVKIIMNNKTLLSSKSTNLLFAKKINRLAAISLILCSSLAASFTPLEPSQARSISNNSDDIASAKPQLIAQSRKNFRQFLRDLAIRETGSRNTPSNIENRFGFLGKFQFGESLLADLGYYKASPNPIYKPWQSNSPSKNLWRNRWTGKRGISSKKDFLRNKNGVQEFAMAEALALNCKYINDALGRKSVNQYLGRRIKGVKVTTSGILAAAHLVGSQKAAKLLTNGEISADENRTSVLAYLKEFGGYQIPNRFAGSCK